MEHHFCQHFLPTCGKRSILLNINYMSIYQHINVYSNKYNIEDVTPEHHSEDVYVFRELMESLGQGVSRVCLDRREMKVPEVSPDPLVPSVCRLVPCTHIQTHLAQSAYNHEPYGSILIHSRFYIKE